MHGCPSGCVAGIRQLQRSNAGHKIEHTALGLTSLRSAKGGHKCPQMLYA